MFKTGDLVQSKTDSDKTGKVLDVNLEDPQRVCVKLEDGPLSIFWDYDLVPFVEDTSEEVLYKYTNTRVAQKDRNPA